MTGEQGRAARERDAAWAGSLACGTGLPATEKERKARLNGLGEWGVGLRGARRALRCCLRGRAPTGGDAAQ
jgi:hypothetical protein